MKRLLLLLASAALLASCGQNLKSESGLYDVTLTHTYKAAVDGAWTHGKGNPYAHKKSGSIYVAPLRVTKEVAKDEPELSAQLMAHMGGYIADHMGRMLAEGNKANGCNWKLATSPAGADIRIDLAIVRLTPRRPGLNIFGQIGGFFSPVPGVSSVVNKFSEGDICIEGTIRDAHSGKLLLAFKDSNRKTVHLYEKDAYTRSGQAEANLDEWARRIAKVCRECAYDRLGDGVYKDKVQRRGVGEAIRARFE